MICCTVLTVLGLFFGAYAASEQQVDLFDDYNSQGNHVSIQSTYVSDLSTVHFDDQTRSLCVTGIWIFYQELNFNPNGTGGVEYVWGQNNHCRNLKTLGGKVSSMKYAGHPKDYTTDSITLYQHTYFQGNEEFAYNQIESLNVLDKVHQSLIITGVNSWTIYDQPHFQGNSICLKVPTSEDSAPVFLVDLKGNLDTFIPYGSIRSARKGCTSQYVMDMNSMVTN